MKKIKFKLIAILVLVLLFLVTIEILSPTNIFHFYEKKKDTLSMLKFMPIEDTFIYIDMKSNEGRKYGDSKNYASDLFAKDSCVADANNETSASLVVVNTKEKKAHTFLKFQVLVLRMRS